jgi:hypothetical protein
MTRPLCHARESGFALFGALLLLLMLASLGSASLLATSTELKTSALYRTSTEAFLAAEAGAHHALSVMNTTLVWNLAEQLEDSSWTDETWMYGSTWQTMPDSTLRRYQVTVSPNSTDPDDQATIVATGTGALDSKRRIRLRVRRSGIYSSPGAVYLVSESVTSDFNGNAFTIDGHDYDLDGTLAASGLVKPGISTRNDDGSANVISTLNSQQTDNIQGLAYDGSTTPPAVVPTDGPDASELDILVDRILTNSSPVVELTANHYNGDCSTSFGTLAAPQVTHMTNDSGIKINGDFCGVGLLIVDGPLDLNGSMNFTGWIIARSTVSLTGTGNSTIRGSLWTNGIEFSAGGSLIVEYSTAGLELANAAGGNPNGNVPRKLTIVSWEEL